MKRYLDLDFEQALKEKWSDGVKTHRAKASPMRFSGDPAEELFEELLDAIHYTRILEDRGAHLPGFRTTLRNMAMTVQAMRHELKPSNLKDS